MKKKNIIIISSIIVAIIIAIGSLFYIYNLPENRISRSMDLVQSLFDNEQWEEAKIELNKVIEIDGTNLDAHIKLADVYKNLSDTENQILVYEKIIEFAPEREQTYLDYAEIYIVQEDWEKAREILQRGSGQAVKDKLAEVEKTIADIEEAERKAREEERIEKEKKEKELFESEKSAALEDLLDSKMLGVTLKEYISLSHSQIRDLIIANCGLMFYDEHYTKAYYISYEHRQSANYGISMYYNPNDKYSAYKNGYHIHGESGLEPEIFQISCSRSADYGEYSMVFENYNAVKKYTNIPDKFLDYNYMEKYDFSINWFYNLNTNYQIFITSSFDENKNFERLHINVHQYSA